MSLKFCCQYVSFTGYVTRFLFSLFSSGDYDCEDDNNCDKYAVQPPERYYHHEGLSKKLCSSVHEQSSNDNDGSQGSRNKYSVEHLYDDDGDLLVKRKCQQFEVIYIG